MSPRNHVLVEGIVDAHRDVVGLPPTQQMSDIQHERGVTLAYMLPSQLAIYPDCGGVEYGFKFDSYRGVLPFAGNIERSLIPGDVSKLYKIRVNLPGVRHRHF